MKRILCVHLGAFLAVTGPFGRVGSAADGGQAAQTAAIAISSVEGGSAALPCDITARENDSVYLVLWYRQDSGTPIYRYCTCIGS